MLYRPIAHHQDETHTTSMSNDEPPQHRFDTVNTTHRFSILTLDNSDKSVYRAIKLLAMAEYTCVCTCSTHVLFACVVAVTGTICHITCGVPQGSVLRALIYSIYYRLVYCNNPLQMHLVCRRYNLVLFFSLNRRSVQQN